MIRLSSDNENSSDIGSVVLEKEPDLKHPPSYQVILINDDFTPMEFVIQLLIEIFNRTTVQAKEIMLTVHDKGKGVAGTYGLEIAEQKQQEATMIARHHGHPLKVVIEKID